MNILIVDDEQGFLDQAKTILENINDDFEIITSSSVNEGLEVLEDKNIDVLVSDYKMPGKDGIDFLKIFKEKLDGDTPFIIFTGKGSEEVAKKALNLGANRYIEKGEDMKNQLNTLSNAIEDELKKKREIKEWKESEHKYRSLLNQAAEMLFLHDTDGNIIEVNQAAIDNTGYSRDELLQMNIFDIDPDAEERRDQTNYWKNLSTQDPPTKIEVRHKRKDGSIYPAEVVLSKVILSDEEYIFAIARDITERKEAQEKLKEEQHRRKVILDNIPGNAFILKKDYREIVFSNKKAKESGAVPGKTCYGTIAERDDPCPFCKAPVLWETGEIQEIEVEYEGTYYRGIWVPYSDEEYIHYIYDITERKRTEKKVIRTKDKIERLHKVSAELETCQSEEEVFKMAVDAVEDILDFDICSFAKVEDNKLIVKERTSGLPKGDYLERPLEEGGIDAKTYQNQESYLIENVNKNKDAKPVKSKYKSAMSIPIGEYGVFQAVATEENYFDENDLDIAELLINNITKALKRLEMKEKEEFLHSLLRHDVRNKCVLVQGYLDLAREFDLPEELEEYITRSKNVTKNGIDIIDKVRKLRKIERKDDIVNTDLKSILKRVILEHEKQLKQKKIDIEFKEIDCKVEGGSLLDDLFSNLIENSIQHSDCDTIKIKMQSEEKMCIVTIEDDGKGINDKEKENIFEKGYKFGKNSGTGLGMYIVKEIINNYDGYIDVKDSEMGGARFDVHLNKAD